MPTFASRPFARGLSAALPALALLACVNDESAPPSLGLELDGALYAYSDTFSIVSDRAPSAGAPGAFVRRSVSPRCEGGEMISDTVTDTTLYTVGKGVLRLWAGGDCLASRLAAEGSKGSSLFGTWTLEGQDSVPAAWRPAACDPSELEYAVGPTGSYVFSRERSIFRTNGGFCLARVYGESMARVLDGLEVSKGCDEVTLRAGASEAALTGEIAGNGVRLRFARAGAMGEEVCEGTLPLALWPPETCAASGTESEVADTGLDALIGCLADFYVDAREIDAPAKATPGQSREVKALIRASAWESAVWPLSR